MAELVLSRVFYRPDAVESAVAAYSSLADISFETDDKDIRVQLKVVDEEVGEELVDAFANHVLFESIVRYRNDSGNDLGKDSAKELGREGKGL